MPAGRATGPANAAAAFRLRPARVEDLPACERIWRTALNDYFGRLGVPLIPSESASVSRLHRHALTTDPAGFVVAEPRPAAPGNAGLRSGGLAGFASALVRGETWFLSMLFVEPAAQRSGLGRALLERVLPAPEARPGLRLALASDSAQPIANGLYASVGIVPRLPIWNLVGRPGAGLLPALPDGITASPDEEPASSEAEVAGMDREILGFAHPEDHRFARESGRHRFLYRAGNGRLAGYGYASPVGHLGPVAVREPEVLAPVVAHLLTAIEPRGASSIWLGGAAGEATELLVRAGLRLDGFPVLMCWSTPFADFARYVPHSPGLL